MRLPVDAERVPLATVLAVVTVIVFLVALVLWISGETAIAGLAFILAALTIYYRETRT